MKTKATNLITIIILIASTIMLAFSGYLGIQITRLCLYVIVFCILVELLFLKFTILQFLCLSLMVVFSFITYYLYGGNYANTLIFLTSVVFAIQAQNCGFEPVVWKSLKLCTYIVLISYIAIYFFTPRWSALGQLMLFFENPNMAGIACCAPVVMQFLIAIENYKKKYNVINWILVALGVYIVYCTQNRGSFIVLLMIAAVTLLALMPQGGIRIHSKMLFNILRIMPIVVPVFYVILFEYLPHNIMILGKPLFSGREYSWALAIKTLLANPFAHQTFEEGTLNLLLEGIVRYGIVAMIAFFVFLFSIQKEDITSCNVVQYVAYTAFFICLFQQCFESTMITGSYSVYIWTYSLLGVAYMQEKPCVLTTVGGVSS